MIWLYISECTKADEHETGRKLAEYAFYDIFKRPALLCHGHNGKPEFENKKNIHVGISHSEKLCVAAISDIEIGVDVEYADGTENRLVRLAERYFTEPEASYVKEAPIPRFYEIWCAKESYMKYTGEGFSRPMSSFSVFDVGLHFSHLMYENYSLCLCSKEKYASDPKYVKL